jgi:RHS repeat-associated protein
MGASFYSVASIQAPPSSLLNSSQAASDELQTISVNWSDVPQADTFFVEERLEGQSNWTAVSGANRLSRQVERGPGTYFYRVKGCVIDEDGNELCEGISQYSPEGSVTVEDSAVSVEWNAKSGAVSDAQLITPSVSASSFNGVMASEGGVSGGAGSYNIPIVVPPGRAGIQPNVSLSYSSRSGNGIAGVGWSLSSGSAISRCPATQAQDGFTNGVWFENNDRLCLDGQRLVVVSGNYGEAGAEYRLELDNFSIVTQLNANLGSAGVEFEVLHASGEKSFYGSTNASRVIPTGVTQTLSWLMDRMEDVSGNNHMTYSYTDMGDGELLLSRIQYTGNGSQEGNREVSFSYEDRLQFSTSYIAGGFTRETQRLRQIMTYYADEDIREYNLTYAPSRASNRSLLRSVQECGLQFGRQCRNAATFDWQDAPVRFETELLRAANGTDLVPGADANGILSRTRSSIPRGDLNGDGVRDWPLQLTNAESEVTAQNTANLQQCMRSWTTTNQICLDGDFNLDGRTDIWESNAATDRLRISYTNDANTINWIETPIQVSQEIVSLLGGLFNEIVHIGDYNGDGWPDLVLFEGSQLANSGASGDIILYTHTRNPQSPYSVSASHRHFLLSVGDAQTVEYVGDMNADGLPDIVMRQMFPNEFTARAESLFLVKTPSEGVVSTEEHSINFNGPRAFAYEPFSIFIDVNGDGLLDWLGTTAERVGGLEARLNKGNGSFSNPHILPISLETRALPTPGRPNGEPDTGEGVRYSSAIKQLDLDSDGRVELLVPNNILVEGCVIPVVGWPEVCGGLVYSPTLVNSDLIAIDSSGDINIYEYQAYRFTETATGELSADIIEDTGIIGQADHSFVQDSFGNGLQDVVTNIGCSSGGCRYPNGAGDTGLQLGNVYINRNYGSTEVANPGPEDYRAPDLMISANNGVGLISQWEYRPLSSDAPGEDFYQVNHNEVVDGEHFLFASSMYVVSEFRQSNGTGAGNLNTMRYQYEDAMYNAFGRGSRGFRKITSIDVTRDNTRTETDFMQIFPYSSLVSRSATYRQGASTPFNETENDWQININHNVPDSFHLFNRLSESITRDINTLNQMSVSTTVVNQADVDEYGNMSAQESVVEDDFGTYTTSMDYVYEPIDTTSTWWPHRKVSSVTTQDVSYRSGANVPNTIAGISNSQSQAMSYVWNDTHRKPAVMTHAAGTNVLTDAQCTASGLNACRSTRTTYNQFGLPTEVETAGAIISGSGDSASTQTRTASISYSSNGTTESGEGYFPLTATNAEDHVVSSRTNAATGLPTRVTAETGVVTDTDYDSLARPIQIDTTGYPAQFVRYHLPDSNQPTGLGAQPIAMVARYQAGVPDTAEYIDVLGRTIRTSSQHFNSGYVFVDQRYDALGRMTHESNLHQGSPTYTRYNGFDIIDRPSSKTTQATLSGSQVVANYTYDSFVTDITTSATSGANLTLQRSYNSADWLMSTVDANGNTTAYAYDGAGNPTVIRDAVSNDIYASYDGLGRKLWVDDPNMGRSNFVYNDFDELELETDANNDSIRYELDRLGRLTRRFGDNQQTGTFVWDTLRDGLMTSHSVGSSSNGVSKTYQYDTAARPTVMTTTIDGESYTTSTLYDGNYGRAKGMVYPNDLTMEFEYNARGFLTHERNGQSGYVYREITEQDAWGNVSDASYTDGALRGTYTYSTRTGQMLSSQVEQGSTAVHYLDYEEYDSYGNLLRQRNRASDVDASESFTYDRLHRLTRSVLGAGGTSTTNNYAYDGVGNFTMKSDYSTTANGAYQYRAGTNQLTQVSLLGGGTASFDYDDKGNLTHRNGNREATFNVFNKPTNINRLSSNVDLLYDANIERYKQVREVEGDTITTLYIDKVFEVETTVSGSQTTVEETTYLGGMAILREDVDGLQRSNPRIDFTHKDRLGSSATFTDHNGQLTARRSFDPFGKPKGGDWTYLSSTGLSARLYNNLQDTDMPTRRGYTDHEHLDEVEIIHMNGRIYDYNVGRFFSVDPFIQGVGNSQGINPYSYVMNNPLGFTDPSGYMTEGVEDLELKTERKQRRGSRIAQEVTTEASGTATDDNGAKVSFTATFSGDKVSSLSTDIGNQDGANRAGEQAGEAKRQSVNEDVSNGIQNGIDSVGELYNYEGSVSADYGRITVNEEGRITNAEVVCDSECISDAKGEVAQNDIDIATMNIRVKHIQSQTAKILAAEGAIVSVGIHGAATVGRSLAYWEALPAVEKAAWILISGDLATIATGGTTQLKKDHTATFLYENAIRSLRPKVKAKALVGKPKVRVDNNGDVIP